MPGPDFTIPASVAPASAMLALDSGAFTAAGCAPTTAHTGKMLGDNDRLLHAHLRRAGGTCFPMALGVAKTVIPPAIGDRAGTRIGPYTMRTTPGCRWIDWYLWVDGTLNDKFWVAPFTVGMPSAHPFRGWGEDPATMFSFTCTGGANGDVVAPIPCPVIPGQVQDAGLVVMSTLDAGASTIGAVVDYAPSWIRGDSGVFLLINSGSIRLIRRATSTPLTEWHQIIGKGSSGIVGAASDIVYVSPDFTNQERATIPAGTGTLGWEIAAQPTCDLWTVYYRERPLSGTLADAEL